MTTQADMPLVTFSHVMNSNYLSRALQTICRNDNDLCCEDIMLIQLKPKLESFGAVFISIILCFIPNYPLHKNFCKAMCNNFRLNYLINNKK